MTPVSPSPALVLRDVVKTFRSGPGEAVHALDRLSLHLRVGELLTVIGSNGAGKSTLLDAVAGGVEIDSGSIHLFGCEAHSLPQHERARWVTRVYQHPAAGLASGLTVRENVLLWGQKGRRSLLRNSYRRSRSRETLAGLESLGLGLEDRLDSPAGTLSLGLQQALAIYLATLGSPRLLLLDEHVSSLDPRAAEVLMELTEHRIRALDLTAVMVTHSLAFARRFGDRLVLMHRGRIVLELGEQDKQRLGERELLEEFRRQVGEYAMEPELLLEGAVG